MMSTLDALTQQLTDLTWRGRQASDSQAWLAALHELLELYERLPSQRETPARQIRQAFLQVLGSLPRDAVDLQEHPHVAHFLAEQIESEDFLGLKWQSPDEVLTYCELFHSF